MKKMLLFTVMACLSFSASQAYADSPIFMDKFKNIFSSGESTNKQPLSLKTKRPAVSQSSSGASGSVSERFKKAVTARKKVLSQRHAIQKRKNMDRIATFQKEQIEKQQLAQTQGAGQNQQTSSSNGRNTQTSSYGASTKRVIVRKKVEDKEKGGLAAPIFMNFR